MGLLCPSIMSPEYSSVQYGQSPVLWYAFVTMKRILSDLSYVSHRRLMSDSDTGAVPVPYTAVCAFVEGEINCNKFC